MTEDYVQGGPFGKQSLLLDLYVYECEVAVM